MEQANWVNKNSEYKIQKMRSLVRKMNRLGSDLGMKLVLGTRNSRWVVRASGRGIETQYYMRHQFSESRSKVHRSMGASAYMTHFNNRSSPCIVS